MLFNLTNLRTMHKCGAHFFIPVAASSVFSKCPAVQAHTSMSHDTFDDAGSQFTGTAINPARALGPAIVFHCHWNVIWLYVIAGMFGAACPAVQVAIQGLLSIQT